MTMRRTLVGSLVLAALAFGACQPQAEEADQGAAADTAEIVASVDSLRSAYEEAFNAGEWQRLETMVTEDAIIVSPGGAVRDSLQGTAGPPYPEGATLEITAAETRVLSADWAYDMGTGVLTWTPEGADEARTLSDTYLVLLRRTPDGWKVHREVASSRPLPEGPQ